MKWITVGEELECTYAMLQLEDIYASLFLVQCDIKMVRERHALGEKQGMRIKFLSGVLVFSLLICLIWAPMVVCYSNFRQPFFAGRRCYP